MKLAGISLLVLAASTAIFTSAHAATLSDNSNITTGVGNGANGANTSSLTTPNSTFGSGSNSTGTNTISLADDFILPTLSTISAITFDAYSTSTYPTTPVSPFTGGTVSIWNAQPGTAGAAVLFTSSTLAATAWTGVYRVQSTTLTNAQRPVFTLSVSFANVPLVAGTYWASFAATGIAAPGVTTSVFTPPVMTTGGALVTGNSVQSTDGGTTWVAVTDGGSLVPLAQPLTVIGTAVPEPTTVALTVLGGIGALAAARRRQQARA